MNTLAGEVLTLPKMSGSVSTPKRLIGNVGAKTINIGGNGDDGAETVIEPLSVSENGTYTAPDGVDGYSPVTVNVPVPDGYIVPSGTKEIAENGTHKVTEFDKVNVNVPIPDGYIQPSGELEVTENGKHDVTAYASVSVDVPTGGGGDGGGSGVLDAILDGSVVEIESNVTTISERALNYQKKLQTVSLPNVTSVGAYAFYYSFEHTSLPPLFLPNLTKAEEYAFGQSGVNIVNLPKLNEVSSNMFSYSSSLESVDLGAATNIKGAAFIGCFRLTALIIRTNSVCSLAYATVFNSTPIKNGTGHVYVPSALVDSYKAATNWSTYAAQFRAIEDYPDICGG